MFFPLIVYKLSELAAIDRFHNPGYEVQYYVIKKSSSASIVHGRAESFQSTLWVRFPLDALDFSRLCAIIMSWNAYYIYSLEESNGF